MTKQIEKVDFDLSKLTLEELIEVYQKITELKGFLDESKIVVKEVSKDE